METKIYRDISEEQVKKRNKEKNKNHGMQEKPPSSRVVVDVENAKFHTATARESIFFARQMCTLEVLNRLYVRDT